MNDLKLFSSSEFGELGVLVMGGKEYFPATQCAKILGYKEPEKAIRAKCKGVSKVDTPTAGGIQTVNYIPEGDLYRLIISSKLPAAEKFERWVFDEVLPSIRRNGGYVVPGGDVETIIARTAAAAATEVIRQMSVLFPKAEPPTAEPEKTPKAPGASPGRPHRQQLKMDKLPASVREQADIMLSSGSSCQQVANYIANTAGVYISTSSVNKYRLRRLESVNEAPCPEAPPTGNTLPQSLPASFMYPGSPPLYNHPYSRT